MAAYAQVFQRDIAIEERVFVVAYTGDAGSDYICMEDGVIHKIGGYSDNTNPITSSWQSKKLDFSDNYPEFANNLKSIDQIQIKYRDIVAGMPVTVYLSDDGGVNWDTRTLVLGNGDGKIKVADTWWMSSERATARFFLIRVESSSTDKGFEFHGMRIFFYMRGEYSEVS